MKNLTTAVRLSAVTLLAILVPADVSDGHPGHATEPEITTDFTWSEDILPIFREKCMNCHNENGITPPEFSLSTYGPTDSASGASDWAYGIMEQVLSKKMPPWGADPRFNTFDNHRFLTQEEIETIVDWVLGGRPEGLPEDAPVPAEIRTRGWSLGEPNMVFEMPKPYSLDEGEAFGQVSVNFPVNIENAEEWITSVEFFPGDPRVVHTMMLFIHDPDDQPAYTFETEGLTDFDSKGGDQEVRRYRTKTLSPATRFLGQWVRGDTPVTLPRNVGKLLRNGSTLELKVYYHRGEFDTIEHRIDDTSKFGIHFTPQDILRVGESLVVENNSFTIPAGEANHEVRASTTLTEGAYLHAVYPHMGLVAKDLELIAHYPDGRSAILLFVPEFTYTFNQSYVFQKPLFAPAETRLELIGHYDNSATNWNNPYDPPKVLEAPGDERLLAYVDFYSPDRIYSEEEDSSEEGLTDQGTGSATDADLQ